MNELLWASIASIVLGFLFGWLIAKARSWRYDKIRLRECIPEEEIRKTMEEDEIYFKMKKEVDDGRKSKHRKARCEPVSSGLDERERTTDRAITAIGSVEDDGEQEPVQATTNSKPSTNRKTAQFYKPESL